MSKRFVTYEKEKGNVYKKGVIPPQYVFTGAYDGDKCVTFDNGITKDDVLKAVIETPEVTLRLCNDGNTDEEHILRLTYRSKNDTYDTAYAVFTSTVFNWNNDVITDYGVEIHSDYDVRLNAVPRYI